MTVAFTAAVTGPGAGTPAGMVTVSDGTKNDLRAALAVVDAVTNSDKALIAAQ